MPGPHSPPRLLLTSSTTTRNLLLVLSTGLTPDSHWTLEKIFGRPNEHLARVEAVGVVEEETLQDWGPEGETT